MALAKSHKRLFVDASNPAHKLGTHYCSNPTNGSLEDCSSFPAVLTFARASKAYRTLIDKRPVPNFQSQQLKHLEIVVFTTGEVGIKHSLHFFGLEDPAASYGFF